MPPIKLVNELLERSAVKIARSVLRGGWQSDLPSLPDYVAPPTIKEFQIPMTKIPNNGPNHLLPIANFQLGFIII